MGMIHENAQGGCCVLVLLGSASGVSVTFSLVSMPDEFVTTLSLFFAQSTHGLAAGYI